uniref:Uncharacterized protein n=1 Tax=Rhizophora mucronata TaxID=61149 RepID=A0A2P2QMU5_RHIMU
MESRNLKDTEKEDRCLRSCFC